MPKKFYFKQLTFAKVCSLVLFDPYRGPYQVLQLWATVDLGLLPSAEKQSVYSTAPVNWATFFLRGAQYGIAAYVLDCDKVESEFDFRSRQYVNHRISFLQSWFDFCRVIISFINKWVDCCRGQPEHSHFNSFKY